MKSPWSARRACAALLLPLIAAACTAAPALAPQDRQTVQDVQAYLNGLHGLQARFVQSGTDGPAQGEVWLQRPGRLRIDYERPPKVLVANGGWLTMSDLSTGASTVLPVANTPLGVLLGDDVDLSGPVEVTGLRRDGGMLRVSLVQRGAPRRGTLSLTFREDPLALAGVTLTDPSGRTDELVLSHVARPDSIDPVEFTLPPAPSAPG